MVIDYSPEAIKNEVNRELEERRTVYPLLIQKEQITRTVANCQFKQLEATIAYISFFETVYEEIPRQPNGEIKELIFEAMQQLDNAETLSAISEELCLTLLKALYEKIDFLEKLPIVTDELRRNTRTTTNRTEIPVVQGEELERAEHETTTNADVVKEGDRRTPEPSSSI